MTSKTNCKQAGIILMITSFNQIYNFLSYFNQNKLMKNTKVYLTIFSDHIPEKLILEFKEYIEDFAKVEILDLRRKSLITYKLKIRFLRIIFYYFFILKKSKLKRDLNPYYKICNLIHYHYVIQLLKIFYLVKI